MKKQLIRIVAAAICVSAVIVTTLSTRAYAVSPDAFTAIAVTSPIASKHNISGYAKLVSNNPTFLAPFAEHSLKKDQTELSDPAALSNDETSVRESASESDAADTTEVLEKKRVPHDPDHSRHISAKVALERMESEKASMKAAREKIESISDTGNEDSADTDNIETDAISDEESTGPVSASEAAVLERIEKEKGAITAANKAIEKAAEENRIKEYEEIVDSMPDHTYIDINLTTQKLTYYINGGTTLCADVVTGNISRNCDTPQGVYEIYGKQKSRTLKGDDYEAFVNYWMPFTGNYGIHDATWRSSFGGDIYQTNGSHGCVNISKSTAATLYETAPVGTKVFVHI
ncbi:MAG: L,D-transpeptidase [Lachnospiraceae bacterium]|nr:L,D-transpeptidase [Lachnospiraceae bacterium]